MRKSADTAILYIRVSTDLKVELERYVLLNEMTFKELVIAALREYLDRWPISTSDL